MRNEKRRNRWRDESEYIVKLTRQLVSKNSLDFIARDAKECGDGYNPIRVRSYVMASIMDEIEEMNDSTLGLICSYGTIMGVHSEPHPPGAVRPKFINRTGLGRLLVPFAKTRRTLHVAEYGGGFIENMAVNVIVCIVIDILMQDKWQAK